MTKINEYIYKRNNGVWYYLRKRPKRIVHLFSSDREHKSLKTKDKATAIVRCEAINDTVELEWARIEAEGNNINSNDVYELALKKAQNLNIKYLTTNNLILENQLNEIVNRVNYLEKQKAPTDLLISKTLIGTVTIPKTSILDALEIFFKEIRSQKKNNVSPSQYRVWKNPRIKAVNNFIKLNGNIDICTIERSHVIKLRSYWLERIIDGVVKPSSAKKDFSYLSKIYFDYFNHIGDFERTNPFRNIVFEDMDNDKRPPFETSFVKEMFLMDVFLELNFEARMLFFAHADTGARPSELCGLNAENIKLNAPTPYIEIVEKKATKNQPGRKLKTTDSYRTIPLIGTALEAFKNFPNGFSRYRDKETNACGTINKFLKVQKLRPTKEHTFYSLRHSFMDRMEEAGLEQEFRHRMTGHSLSEQEYGKGGSLEFRAKKLKLIELPFNSKLFVK